MEKKWRGLNFKEKLAVIKMICTKGRSVRDVVEHFKCGRTQVYSILKQKDKILEKYRSNANVNMLRMRERGSKYRDLDSIILKWVLEAKEYNIFITGPIIQRKAKEVAESLNIESFSASNGWLQSFKKRHGITFNRSAEETKDPDLLTDDVGINDGSNITQEGDTDTYVPAETEEVGLEEVAEQTDAGDKLENEQSEEESEEVPKLSQVLSYVEAMKQYAKAAGDDDLYRKVVDLGSSLDPGITECKTRWRTIRDSYKKNKKKLNSNPGSSLPKSKYSNDNLKFLDDSYTEGTSHDSEIHDQSAAKYDVPEYVQLETGEDMPPEDDADDSEPLNKKPRFLEVKEELLDEVESDCNVLEGHTSHHQSERDEEHPIQIFFRSMAATVMTFPPNVIAETRMKICEIVSEMEIRVLKEKQQVNNV